MKLTELNNNRRKQFLFNFILPKIKNNKKANNSKLFLMVKEFE